MVTSVDALDEPMNQRRMLRDLAPVPAVIVAVALVAAGWWLGRETATMQIHEVTGVVTAVSDPGSSLCIGPTLDTQEVDCQALLMTPGERLPAVGDEVVAGWIDRPTSGSTRLGAWLYVWQVAAD